MWGTNVVNKEDASDDKKDFTDDSNSVKSTTDLWQQYSPMSWSEIYSEFLKYTKRMTEIYYEYAGSSQRMRDLYRDLAANAEKMTELYKESGKCTEEMNKCWLNYIWMNPWSRNSKETQKHQEQEE